MTRTRTVHLHDRDVDRFLGGDHREPAEVIVALDDADGVVGFVELSIRNIVDSCRTDRVAYLKGWYVVSEARRRGIGGALIAAAERWAKSVGCREFASDTALDDDESQRAHAALGFVETGRSVNFRKEI